MTSLQPRCFVGLGIDVGDFRAQIDEETNPQRFSQVFHLVEDGDAFFVINDIFRLNYS